MSQDQGDDPAYTTSTCCRECISRLSILASLLSLGLLGASVGTDRWTYTSEPLVTPSPSSNSTKTAPVSTVTTVCGVVRFRAGLWRACPNLTAKNSTGVAAFATHALAKYGRSIAGYPRAPMCIPIPFVTAEMTLPVWKEAVFAGALFDRMRLSVPFFLMSLVFVSLAMLTSVLGHILQNVTMLLAAVTSVLAGLALGGGLVIYVTVASEEFEFAVRHRPPPRWHEEDNLWQRYGASFYGACLSLLLVQLSALLAISSYLHRLRSRGLLANVIPGLRRRISERCQQRLTASRSQRGVPVLTKDRDTKRSIKDDIALVSLSTLENTSVAL